jgi:hypothetical protein
VAEYRYLAHDLRTNGLLTELPLGGVVYSSYLNTFGTIQGQLQLPPQQSKAVLAEQYVAATEPQRIALYVERDGVIVWGGIIWTRDYDPETFILTLGGSEFWSYFGYRLVAETKQYAAVDQHLIFVDVVEYAQAQQGGNIGVDTSAVLPSGVLRDRTYWHYERKPIDEACRQLANVEGGFDFAIDVGYEGSAIVKRLTLSYPRRGRLATVTEHVFEVGRNVVIMSWPEDGTRGANRVHALGLGEGDDKHIAVASDTALIDAGYPLMEATVSRSDVSEEDTLVAHANAELTDRSRPVTLPNVTVRADLDPVFGSYIVGDDARLIAAPGDDPRWPGGLDTTRRIVGWEVTVPDEGATENVKLTLGDAV